MINSAASSARGARLDAASRQAAIADAARGLALDEGLTALTLRAVAARAGVASGLVAHYFPVMHELVARTFISVVAAELDQVRARVAAHDDPLSRVSALIESLFDEGWEPITRVWLDAFSLGMRAPLVSAAAREEMAAWHAVTVDVLAPAAQPGSLAARDPALTAWYLIGAVDGLNAQGIIGYGDTAGRIQALAAGVEAHLGLVPGRLLSVLRVP